MNKIKNIFFTLIFSISIIYTQDFASMEKDTVFQMPPVLITATRAVERETPVTFSNISQEKIKTYYTYQDFPAFVADQPSIIHYSFNGNDVGYSFINLRGFDQRRLSIMINGIPQNDPEDHQVYWIDMPNLLEFTNNIQFQRGAGSMFYGPPAIGGSVNIVTTPIDIHPRIGVSSYLGWQEFGGKNKIQLNSRKYSINVSSGLINNRYMIYGNLSKITSDGYRNHSWATLHSYFLGVIRYDENMTTRVNIYGGPVADAHAYVGIPKYFNKDKKLRLENYSYWEYSGDTVSFGVPQKPQAIENFSQPHYELINDLKLTENIMLSNTIFYIQGDGFFDYDGDWVQYDPFAIDWFRRYVGYDTTFGTDQKFVSLLLKGFVGNKQYGWLPRIDIEQQNGKLSIGGELRIHRSIHWGKIQNASEFPNPFYDPDFRFYEYTGEKDIVSLYANQNYKVNQNANLMLNLQLVFNRYGIKKEKFLNNHFDIDYFFINPRVGINYNFTDELNGYATIAYTSREPRLRNLYAAEDAWFGALPEFEKNTDGSYNFKKPFAKPEHLLNVEIGGRYNFSNGKISANFYFMDFKNELVRSGKIDIFGGSILMNANKTRHIGVELDMNYKIVPDLELTGNLTLSKNKIISHKFFDTRDSLFRILDNNPIAGFPDVLANLRLSYSHKGLNTSISSKYVGEFYTDNLYNPKNKVDAYDVYDLDLSYDFKNILKSVDFTLMLKIKNLFNKLYLAYGEGSAFFPAAERNYQLGLKINY